MLFKSLTRSLSPRLRAGHPHAGVSSALWIVGKQIRLSGRNFAILVPASLGQPHSRHGFVRPYSTGTPPPDPLNGEQPPKSDTSSTMPPEKWIEALENAANAPWLAGMPKSPTDRLKRAYAHIFHVVMYLGRPQNGSTEVEQYLVDFEKATAEPTSELHRARNAITILTRSVVRDVSSIPVSDPLRTAHPTMFDIFGALVPLHDMYLSDGGEAPGVPEWGAFWERAQPILLTLGMKMDDEGFGFREEEADSKKEGEEDGRGATEKVDEAKEGSSSKGN